MGDRMTFTIYSLNETGDLCSPMAIVAESHEQALREAQMMLAPDEEGEVWRNGHRVGAARGLPQAAAFAIDLLARPR
jgi:hypothetical protein